MANPYYDPYRVAGQEVSSTSGGRHILVEEAYLIHPFHADGLVRKGDPVAFFDGAGVALKTASSAGEAIPIDTEGVWRLSVTNTGLNTFRSITVGQVLYIDSSGIIIDDWNTAFTVFGYALQPIAAPINGSVTEIIAVKVHWMWPMWYYMPYLDDLLDNAAALLALL